jgi:mannitol-specific phosphotransferase system IIBC component
MAQASAASGDVGAGGTSLRMKVQRFGSFLSGMVMPNIGAFIAWGLITAIFIPEGWYPNERLAEADLITTAVGPSVLPPLIAKGLVERVRRGGAPVNVIACENMIGASQALRGFVMEHVPDEHAEAVKEFSGFPNAAVDRIVPERQA